MSQAHPVSPPILIVEDDEQIAYLLEFMLTREGFQAEVAHDGEEAALRLQRPPVPAGVLLDAMLPYRNGIELVRLIRENRDTAHIPVVMLTGKSGEADIVRALDAGVSDYVVKPYQPSELVARLRRLLAGKA